MNHTRYSLRSQQAVSLSIAAGTAALVGVFAALGKLDAGTFLLPTTTLGVIPLLTGPTAALKSASGDRPRLARREYLARLAQAHSVATSCRSTSANRLLSILASPGIRGCCAKARGHTKGTI